MSDIKITLEGRQGSGKSRLQLKIEEYLMNEGFKLKTGLTDNHHFTVINPKLTLDKK